MQTESLNSSTVRFMEWMVNFILKKQNRKRLDILIISKGLAKKLINLLIAIDRWQKVFYKCSFQQMFHYGLLV